MYTIIRIRNIILDSRKTYTFNRITRIYTRSIIISIANHTFPVKAQHTNIRALFNNIIILVIWTALNSLSFMEIFTVIMIMSLLDLQCVCVCVCMSTRLHIYKHVSGYIKGSAVATIDRLQRVVYVLNVYASIVFHCNTIWITWYSMYIADSFYSYKLYFYYNNNTTIYGYIMSY